jgi:hypothetical protein
VSNKKQSQKLNPFYILKLSLSLSLSLSLISEIEKLCQWLLLLLSFFLVMNNAWDFYQPQKCSLEVEANCSK